MRSLPGLPMLFTAQDLRRLGVTQEQAEYRVRRRLWRRLQRGVYCLSTAWDTSDAEGRHLLAAVATARAADGAGVVLRHVSAALAHHLPVAREALEMVTVTSAPGSRRVADGHGRRTYFAAVPQDDVTRRLGVDVTTSERTVVDCLRHLPRGDAVAIADAALHAGITSFEAIRDVLDRQRRWPFAGVALAALPLVDGRRESRLESRSAVVMHDHGVPPPIPQAKILDVDRLLVARVDFYWPEWGVVGEADGRVKYAGDGAVTIEKEKDRHALLEALDLVVVRWDERHLYGPEPVLVTRLRKGFIRGDGRRFRGRAA